MRGCADLDRTHRIQLIHLLILIIYNTYMIFFLEQKLDSIFKRISGEN